MDKRLRIKELIEESLSYHLKKHPRHIGVRSGISTIQQEELEERDRRNSTWKKSEEKLGRKVKQENSEEELKKSEEKCEED